MRPIQNTCIKKKTGWDQFKTQAYRREEYETNSRHGHKEEKRIRPIQGTDKKKIIGWDQFKTHA